MLRQIEKIGRHLLADQPTSRSIIQGLSGSRPLIRLRMSLNSRMSTLTDV